GSYGPGAVLYHVGGYEQWNDSDPMEHKYVMYYDVAPQNCIPGETEATALAYSVDGIYWKRYGDQPVMVSGSDGAWDSQYVYAWTVIEENDGYRMWYSGGAGASHEGIGFAASVDGIHWTANFDNPVFHIDDGVAWRNDRSYTPAVLRIGETYHMWFAGKDSLEFNYSIGYATSALPLLEVYLDIMPGIYPNIIPWNKHGFTDVAILGTRDFNVRDIDINTIILENVTPERAKFRDISAPAAGNQNDSSRPRRRGDGIIDLVLTFRTSELVQSLSRVEGRDEIMLTLTGKLSSGRQIVGRDEVIIRSGDKKRPVKPPKGHSFGKPVLAAGDADPEEFSLSGNYPNPFNPTTSIRYDIPRASHVTLTIYNMNGQVVEKLVNQKQGPGFYSVSWDASQYSSGVYYCQIQVTDPSQSGGDFQQVKKMLLIK
ncbi:MAG: T9SS type A sorting domain-containing protein, partial [Candidatus Marinimicrobia bacterium]|nr:T9SS type A sorting domain-containing protein [Candidatus Neomarinimicrobiota bacterium]